ncbi:hypothetical protein D3C71_1063720 [compost metagenome]
MVVTHQFATGVVTQADAALGRGHLEATFKRVAARADVAIERDFATQVQRATGIGRQPRLHQRQRQGIAAQLQAIARPVGARAYRTAGGRAQAGFAEGEVAALHVERRRLPQLPRRALDRRQSQRGQFATPCLPGLTHAAAQCDGAQLVAGLGIQMQVLHAATRVDAHLVQQHAHFHRAALHLQGTVVALPRQAAVDADLAGLPVVPLQAAAAQVGGDVGLARRTAQLQGAGQAAAAAGQQVGQMQRLQPCVHVHAVADLALGFDAAVAHHQAHVALALGALQGELGACIHAAAAQPALELRHVHGGLEAHCVATGRRRQLLALGGERAGQIAFPARQEITGVETGQPRIHIPGQHRRPRGGASQVQRATRCGRLELFDTGLLIVAAHVEIEAGVLCFAGDVGLADGGPVLEVAGHAQPRFFQVHRYRRGVRRGRVRLRRPRELVGHHRKAEAGVLRVAEIRSALQPHAAAEDFGHQR